MEAEKYTCRTKRVDIIKHSVEGLNSKSPLETIKSLHAVPCC